MCSDGDNSDMSGSSDGGGRGRNDASGSSADASGDDALTRFLVERYRLWLPELPGDQFGGPFVGRISHKPWQLQPIFSCKTQDGEFSREGGGVFLEHLESSMLDLLLPPRKRPAPLVHFGTVHGTVDFFRFK